MKKELEELKEEFNEKFKEHFDYHVEYWFAPRDEDEDWDELSDIRDNLWNFFLPYITKTTDEIKREAVMDFAKYVGAMISPEVGQLFVKKADEYLQGKVGLYELERLTQQSLDGGDEE